MDYKTGEVWDFERGILYGGIISDWFWRSIRAREGFTCLLGVNVKVFEETSLRKYQSHVMVKLIWRSKADTGEMWNMLTLLDVKESGIEISKWMGRLLKILVEEYVKTEVYVLHHIDSEQKKMSDINEGF